MIMVEEAVIMVLRGQPMPCHKVEALHILGTLRQWALLRSEESQVKRGGAFVTKGKEAMCHRRQHRSHHQHPHGV